MWGLLVNNATNGYKDMNVSHWICEVLNILTCEKFTVVVSVCELLVQLIALSILSGERSF
jgi:hypothetical protein